MDQNRSITKPPKVAYPPQSTIGHAHTPPYYCDTMAAHYVHSLTSNPYYYYIPRYSYASGYYYPYHRYAYKGPQFGFSQATIPALGMPTSHGDQSYMSPNKHVENPESQRTSDQVEAEKSNQSSEQVDGDAGISIIDPRIISILEPFRQFYSEREESLKNILPGLYDKLSEFFKQVNTLVLNTANSEAERSNGRTLTRSLSMGSAPRNEWFKVRPIDSEDTGMVPPDSINGDE